MHSGAGSELGPQSRAGDKELATAPSPKTKAPCPGAAWPDTMKQHQSCPARSLHLVSRRRLAPRHSPTQAALVANFPRQRSPSLDLGRSIDSCSCAIAACSHIGEGRKCLLDPPSRPLGSQDRPVSVSFELRCALKPAWGCKFLRAPKRSSVLGDGGRVPAVFRKNQKKSINCTSILVRGGAFLVPLKGSRGRNGVLRRHL